MTCTRCGVFSRDRAEVLQGPLTWPQEPRLLTGGGYGRQPRRRPGSAR